MALKTLSWQLLLTPLTRVPPLSTHPAFSRGLVSLSWWLLRELVMTREASETRKAWHHPAATQDALNHSRSSVTAKIPKTA
jgi:hypothetical protein